MTKPVNLDSWYKMRNVGLVYLDVCIVPIRLRLQNSLASKAICYIVVDV